MQNRRLGFIDTFSLVVGTIIGTGIFLKAGIMSQIIGNAPYVLIAWIAAAFLSLAGALTYAELGSRFPEAGGEYVFLRKAYGDLTGFLYGWQRFWASAPGSIAAYAVGAATFAAPLFDMSIIGGTKGFAIILIVTFTIINCGTVVLGGHVQSFLTALKIGLILFVIIGVFGFSASASATNLTSGSGGWPGFSAFGSAMLAALWAYDGWNNMPMAAGEIKNPKRNIPLAMLTGMMMIVAVYLAMNVAYFYALPFSEVMASNSKFNPEALPVATRAAETFLGAAGFLVLAGGLFLSATGAMNGSILTNSRVTYALANDGLFVRNFARLHPKTQTPVFALIVQGVLSCLLALSGTFDQLTDYVVFASWIFYALAAGSVFVYRKKHKVTDGYVVPGYPVVPFLFIVSTILLLVNTLMTSPKESLFGLAIISAGVPAYWLLKKRAAV